MALKAVIASLTDVDEFVRMHYEPRADGKFALKLEGLEGYVEQKKYDADIAARDAKVIEFRDHNVGLLKKVGEADAKLKTYDGIDPTEHVALKEKVAAIEKKGVKEPGDVQSIVSKQVAEAVGPIQKKLEEAEKREAEKTAALARRDLENAIREVGAKVGVDDRAMPDYVRRGLDVFTLEEGKPTAKSPNGPVFSKQNPSEPLGVEEWATGLMSEAPFLFKSSKGGGAATGGGGTGAGVPRRMTIPRDQPIMLNDADRKAVADGTLAIDRT